MKRVQSGCRRERGGRRRAVLLAAGLLAGQVIASGGIQAVAVAASPLVAAVSTTTPYDAEVVTVTVSGLAAGIYEIGYLVSLGELFDPFAAGNTVSLAPLATGVDVDGTGSLSSTIPWELDFDTGGEAMILPGVVVVYPATLSSPAAFGDFSAVSAQMFPGRGKNGSPNFVIEGEGFVDGAFVAGKDITVTATGFPDGTVLVGGVAWVPTTATGDVSADFWRDYLNCQYGVRANYSCPFPDGTPVAGFMANYNVLTESLVGGGTAPSAEMALWVYHIGERVTGGEFFGYDVFTTSELLRTVEGADLGDESPEPGRDPQLSLACVPLTPGVGSVVTCRVTGGDPGVDILWRAAYNPPFAGAGMRLDADGTGEFSFVVPRAALGQAVTVELVEWLAPVSLGVVGGPVPTSVPSGGGPVPVWSLVLLALVGGLVLRRMSVVSVRG